MSGLAVTIVSYNTRDQLRRCLGSLEGARVEVDLDITVVDNASSDGSAAMVTHEFPTVRLLALSENVGFAAGNNAAVTQVAADYVLILNPDVEINGKALSRMVAFLDKTPGAAAVAPLLRGDDGVAHSHLYRRFPTRMQLALFWTVLAPLSRAIPWARRRWLEHDLRGNAPVEVDQIPGAALMIRRSVLREVGAMDPGFFIWFEDVDWCYRARLAGFPLYVLPTVAALHEGGASFQSWTTETRVFQFYRAFIRFLCKHRLDHLRRFALPLFTVDLLVKQTVFALAAPFRSAVSDRRVSFAHTLRAMRAVVARHRAGELPDFTAADLAHSAGEYTEPPPYAPSPRTPAPGWPLPAARTDVIIVNWNGRRYLPACLAALRQSTVPLRIVMVDNASSDDSVSYVREQHKHVELIALNENVGYAAGANAGLRATAGEYAIIINPDVSLSPDHLEVLERRLDSDPAIGAAQGKLYQIDPADFTAERFDSTARLDSAGHEIRRSRMVVDRGQGRPDGLEYSREAAIFSACGAALFLRRAMLEDIAPDGEYFAEAFFAYKEDIDLGWRARQMGWDVRYVPEATAHHVRSLPLAGDSWRHMPLPARRHSWKNHYLLMIRNDSIGDIVRSLPFVAAWEIARIAHAVLRDPRVLRAYIDLGRELGPALRARRDIQRRRRASAPAVRKWFGAEPIPVRESVQPGTRAAVPR